MNWLTKLVGVVAVCAASSASAATITAVTNGTVVSAPTDLTNDSPTSQTTVSGFTEATGVIIGLGGLVMDIGGTLAAGTVVDSHMFYFNNDGANDRTFNDITATFSFDRDILGFITATGKLNTTDGLLGAPGTSYPDFSARGFEGDDEITSFDTNSFTVFLEITQPGDWFRVITAPGGQDISDVPLPAGAPLLLAGMAAFAAMRRKKHS